VRLVFNFIVGLLIGGIGLAMYPAWVNDVITPMYQMMQQLVPSMSADMSFEWKAIPYVILLLILYAVYLAFQGRLSLGGGDKEQR